MVAVISKQDTLVLPKFVSHDDNDDDLLLQLRKSGCWRC